MAHTSSHELSPAEYQKAKKDAYLGFWILLGVTVFEVAVSLLGKGWIPGTEGLAKLSWVVIAAGAIIAVLSIYKARYIILEFMHLGHEVQGLRFSVLLPTVLLIWAIIAFFQEGDAWRKRRELIKDKNEIRLDADGNIIAPAAELKG
ncbi:MAG: cytochrome C oxidase subunit IV family protein [Saprospiraceae bacterium]|nr:cytochrome C oxidase subunit IV family protein [Saprospiraceae bacterium]